MYISRKGLYVLHGGEDVVLPMPPSRRPFHPPSFKVKFECDKNCEYFKRGKCNKKIYAKQGKCFLIEDFLNGVHKKIIEELHGKKAEKVWRIA